MKRRRTIAAAPVRSALEAWHVVAKLVADTLERSQEIPAGSVVHELEPLLGLGPALIAGGHLESNGLVLVDVNLHLEILVMTADAAMTVEENLNPVPGGATATPAWMLYLPRRGPLGAIIEETVGHANHLSADPPPRSATARKTVRRPSDSLIDMAALQRMGT